MKKGFTLIELLIVVAIIAILAAIAVPNFLEAQTRAKISRTRADMRSIATALETYRLDHNNYPVDGGNKAKDFHWPPNNPQTLGTTFGQFRLNNMITTPISYLSTTIKDPFVVSKPDAIYQTYRYFEIKNGYLHFHPAAPLPTVYSTYAAIMGDWQLISEGPDKEADAAGSPKNAPLPPKWLYNMFVPYDATNGTVSNGDIIRSQKSGENYVYP